MDEDEVLGKITRLLEQGCTMLATHHDCGAPLFRCQGEVVCPVCSFPDKSLSNDLEERPGTASQLNIIGPESGPLLKKEAIENSSKRPDTREAIRYDAEGEEDVEFIRAKANLRASLLRRLGELTSGVEEEQDLDKLKKQLDCIEGLLRVFRSMQG